MMQDTPEKESAKKEETASNEAGLKEYLFDCGTIKAKNKSEARQKYEKMKKKNDKKTKE